MDMKYSIYIDKKLFYQTDDYKDGLSTMLTSTISNQEEIEFFYDKFMMFRIKGPEQLDFVKQGLFNRIV